MHPLIPYVCFVYLQSSCIIPKHLRCTSPFAKRTTASTLMFSNILPTKLLLSQTFLVVVRGVDMEPL